MVTFDQAIADFARVARDNGVTTHQFRAYFEKQAMRQNVMDALISEGVVFKTINGKGPVPIVLYHWVKV